MRYRRQGNSASACKHVGLISIFLLFPLLVCREAHLSPDTILDVLSLSMLAMGAGAILPALARGPVGSGYLCPSIFTVAYLGPSLLALKAGGLSLVFGMTVFAGCIEAALSRLLGTCAPFRPRLRARGRAVGGHDRRNRIAISSAPLPDGGAGGKLAVVRSAQTMVALNVGRGISSMLCAPWGCRYAAAALLGVLTASDCTS
jgi:NCS2 family nucleobase:cation symporter-2